MYSSRSSQGLTKMFFKDKCKIESCHRPRRIGSIGRSNYCKTHEAYIFLIKFKYSLKKLFRTVSSGFAVLKGESGNYFSLKELSNFMNFLMIPYLIDDLQNVFEVIGKKYRNKNISVISIEDMKKTMKSKEYKEILEVEIRIVYEVILGYIKTHTFRLMINNLDFDNDGIIDLNDFIRVFKVREAQAVMFFQNKFQQIHVTVTEFTGLFPDKCENCLNLADFYFDSGSSSFFPQLITETSDTREELMERSNYMSPVEMNILEKLREYLIRSFTEFDAAFYAFANSNNELGYFQVLKMLRCFSLDFTEENCHFVLSSLSKGSTIGLQVFKEFWFSNKDICHYDVCVKNAINSEGFCELHLGIKQKKALILMEKLKSQTSLWKSPRKVLDYYRDLEIASTKNNFRKLTGQVHEIVPLKETPKASLKCLHSILGKIN